MDDVGGKVASTSCVPAASVPKKTGLSKAGKVRAKVAKEMYSVFSVGSGCLAPPHGER